MNERNTDQVNQNKQYQEHKAKGLEQELDDTRKQLQKAQMDL